MRETTRTVCIVMGHFSLHSIKYKPGFLIRLCLVHHTFFGTLGTPGGKGNGRYQGGWKGRGMKVAGSLGGAMEGRCNNILRQGAGNKVTPLLSGFYMLTIQILIYVIIYNC